VIQEADGSSHARTVLLKELTVGQDMQLVHARNLGALMSDLTQVSKVMGRRIDGIVGLSFMAGFVIEVDYSKKTLRFLSPRRFTIADRKPDNQSTFLFPLTNAEPKRPISNLLIAGKLIGDYDYDFILDTGFGGYVSVAKSAAQLSGLLRNETARIPAESYSVSHKFRSEKIRASFLMLGEINISNRIIQVDTRNGDTYGQNGIIGNRLLQNYRLTLDYARHKLWLERVTTKEEPDEAGKPMLGLTVRTDGGMIHVVRVAPASPAAHAGVQNGDAILRIDGLTIQDIGMATAIAVLASPDGPTDIELQHDSGATAENPVTVKLIPASPLDWHAE
jgi:predicted aspartyl protease